MAIVVTEELPSERVPSVESRDTKSTLSRGKNAVEEKIPTVAIFLGWEYDLSIF